MALKLGPINGFKRTSTNRERMVLRQIWLLRSDQRDENGKATSSYRDCAHRLSKCASMNSSTRTGLGKLSEVPAPEISGHRRHSLTD